MTSTQMLYATCGLLLLDGFLIGLYIGARCLAKRLDSIHDGEV